MSSIPQRRICGVYRVRHNTSDRVYIGSSVNVEQRLRDHRSQLLRGVHKNPYLQNAWNKHGADAFSFELIEEVADGRDLRMVEQSYIDAAPIKKRYNINPLASVPPSQRGVSPSAETRAKLGRASRGRKHTEESRAKISVAARRQHAETPYVPSPETKEKIRAKNTGRVKTEAEREKLRQANLGKKRSVESRERQSQAIKGRALTVEHREKIRLGGLGKHKGRKASPETRERLRQSHLGKSNGPRSEETKEKIRQGHLRRRQSS